MPSYFDADFNKFFKELAANNSKDWFDENRKRYFKSVKEPFEAFCYQLILALKPHMPDLDPDPRRAIFRINRDIRFARDKSPYKLNRSAHFSNYERKDTAHPGFYLELGPERIYFAGGTYMADKDQVMQIRRAIVQDSKGWYEAVNSPDFVATYGEVKGEENKRIPDKELMQAAEEHPVLLKKQFYYECSLPPENVTSPDLLDKCMARYEASLPVAAFLSKALED